MAFTAPKRGRRGRAPMAEINVTPLVDVMLVLLIIFMVTAPLLTAAVPVELPDSRANPVDADAEPLAISLDADGRIYLDEDEVQAADLPARLEAAAAAAAPPAVLLRADRALDYGRVMLVMGELNRAGLNKVSLVTNAGAGAP